MQCAREPTAAKVIVAVEHIATNQSRHGRMDVAILDQVH